MRVAGFTKHISLGHMQVKHRPAVRRDHRIIRQIPVSNALPRLQKKIPRKRERLPQSICASWIIRQRQHTDPVRRFGFLGKRTDYDERFRILWKQADPGLFDPHVRDLSYNFVLRKKGVTKTGTWG